MTYTIISAKYANAAETAADVMTEEAASVMMSPQDTPEDWADLLAWGTPAPYQSPLIKPAPEPVE